MDKVKGTKTNFKEEKKKKLYVVAYENNTTLTFYEPTWKDIILAAWYKLTNHNRE